MPWYDAIISPIKTIVETELGRRVVGGVRKTPLLATATIGLGALAAFKSGADFSSANMEGATHYLKNKTNDLTDWWNTPTLKTTLDNNPVINMPNKTSVKVTKPDGRVEYIDSFEKMPDTQKWKSPDGNYYEKVERITNLAPSSKYNKDLDKDSYERKHIKSTYANQFAKHMEKSRDESHPNYRERQIRNLQKANLIKEEVPLFTKLYQTTKSTVLMDDNIGEKKQALEKHYQANPTQSAKFVHHTDVLLGNKRKLFQKKQQVQSKAIESVSHTRQLKDMISAEKYDKLIAPSYLIGSLNDNIYNLKHKSEKHKGTPLGNAYHQELLEQYRQMPNNPLGKLVAWFG